MRISDWSSDVCSSDLWRGGPACRSAHQRRRACPGIEPHAGRYRMQQLSAPGEGRIIRIAPRGDGVTADGLHVAGAAPGELVNADGEVVERGPHHASPPCRHRSDEHTSELQPIMRNSY